MESFSRAILTLLVAVLLLQVAGVGGQGVARSPAEAWGRVTHWLRSKFVGGV